MPLARSLARPLALALAAGLAASACDDGAGPEAQMTGQYRLVNVDGGALPFTVDAGIGSRYELTASTLAFSGSGIVEEQRYQWRTNAGTVTDTAVDTATYGYTLSDDVLVIRHPLPSSATRVDTAERAGDLIAFQQRFFSSTGAAVFGQATYARIP